MNKRIGIIGAGLSSLYAACYLAKKGYRVTIHEKHDQVGGRSRHFEQSGYKFDMGPTWYWMPQLVDSLFEEIGEDRSTYFDLHRLDPAYRVFWNDKSYDDLPAFRNELEHFFGNLENGGDVKIKNFLSDAKTKYEIATNDFLSNPGLSWTEIMQFKALKSALKLDVFKSVEKDINSRFESDRARGILKFPVLFLGAMPERIPSLYTLMNYADLELGTWYPKNGMQSLALALAQIAKNNDAQILLNENVLSIDSQNDQVKGITTSSGKYEYDFIISGADYHFTEQNLLEAKYRRYDAKYWDKREMAPSALIFYLGFNKKLEGLQHHNLFFDEDLKIHGDSIYKSKSWPTHPLFYSCLSSKIDKNVAPEGHENMYILIPIATDLEDSSETRDKYLDIVLDRMEMHLGYGLRDSIDYKNSYCVSDFKNDYNSYKGNAYGLANTLFQTANFKPKMKSKLKGLYFSGQLTVPGPGIPPSLISGKIAAKQILKDERTI